MNVNMPGMGALYPSTFRNADGDYLVGEKTYRLHLPANVPAALFWSVTLYSPVNGTMVNAGQPFPSINSMSKVATNPDGSNIEQLLTQLHTSEYDAFAAHLYRSRREYRSVCQRAGKSGKQIERCVISTFRVRGKHRLQRRPSPMGTPAADW